LVGYGANRTGVHILLVLPLALSIAFCLIADIDSPRGGAIRVHPDNLVSLSLAWTIAEEESPNATLVQIRVAAQVTPLDAFLGIFRGYAIFNPTTLVDVQ
jgi:hypothetical protein